MLWVFGLAISSWFAVGSVWTMQILNYPLLTRVGTEDFAAYERAHNRRFAIVMGPPVAVAILSLVALALPGPRRVGEAELFAAAGLMVIIITLTALFAAPAHARLANGFDRRAYDRLILSSWLRTLAWSALAGLSAWMIFHALD